MTLDGWTTNLYNLWNASTYPVIPIVFLISAVFILSFFMLNLLLAVILESYTRCDAQFTELYEKKVYQQLVDKTDEAYEVLQKRAA